MSKIHKIWSIAENMHQKFNIGALLPLNSIGRRTASKEKAELALEAIFSLYPGSRATIAEWEFDEAALFGGHEYESPMAKCVWSELRYGPEADEGERCGLREQLKWTELEIERQSKIKSELLGKIAAIEERIQKRRKNESEPEIELG